MPWINIFIFYTIIWYTALHCILINKIFSVMSLNRFIARDKNLRTVHFFEYLMPAKTMLSIALICFIKYFVDILLLIFKCARPPSPLLVHFIRKSFKDSKCEVANMIQICHLLLQALWCGVPVLLEIFCYSIIVFLGLNSLIRHDSSMLLLKLSSLSSFCTRKKHIVVVLQSYFPIFCLKAWANIIIIVFTSVHACTGWPRLLLMVWD